MLQLIRKVREAAHGELSLEWLKPFMKERRYQQGEVLFRKGEVAEAMFFIVMGRYRLVELGIEIASGELVGELGLLAPNRCRTQTLECVENGCVLSISYKEVTQLYFQNPKFGFYFLRLITGRLFQNIAHMQSEHTEERGLPTSQ